MKENNSNKDAINQKKKKKGKKTCKDMQKIHNQNVPALLNTLFICR